MVTPTKAAKQTIPVKSVKHSGRAKMLESSILDQAEPSQMSNQE